MRIGFPPLFSVAACGAPCGATQNSAHSSSPPAGKASVRRPDGADNATNIEVTAAERIMDQHLVNLYGLRGMWLDKPGRP